VLSLLAAGLLVPPPTAAQQPPPLPQSLSELVRVKPDVYAFRYQSHVAMFIPTDEGVIVVDPIGQSNRQAPAVLKEAIRSVTDQPVRWLLYSHWGADHGIGGIVFRDTATFLSHRNAAPKIAAANDPTSPVPDVTFDGGITLEVGGKTLILQHTALSPEAMVAAVREALTPKYGTWQNFPAGLAQNVAGVIRWAGPASAS
jgi:glyoxylase-like metal-dependent hydrolase (beta-lactamase superfamily II)